jgi:hypothetical protein
LLAIAFTGWAFQSGRGRRWAYLAYLPVLAVASLFFVDAMGAILGLGGLDPVPIVFVALFVVVLMLGVYGYASRHRGPAMSDGEETMPGSAGGNGTKNVS